MFSLRPQLQNMRISFMAEMYVTHFATPTPSLSLDQSPPPNTPFQSDTWTGVLQLHLNGRSFSYSYLFAPHLSSIPPGPHEYYGAVIF